MSIPNVDFVDEDDAELILNIYNREVVSLKNEKENKLFLNYILLLYVLCNKRQQIREPKAFIISTLPNLID